MHVNQPNHSDLTDAVNILTKRDSKLAVVIDQIGPCNLERGEQGLTALAYSIAGQQLSKNSAQAIRSKLDALFGNDGIEPEKLARINDEELRKTGLSLMKVRYLRDLTNHVLTGKINFHKLESMDDETIIRTLSRVKGIGRWTAEMYLIFSLRRLDVFPIGDTALRAAMAYIYSLPNIGFDAQAGKIADCWRPFRTVGCWYLYHYLDMSRSNKKGK